MKFYNIIEVIEMFVLSTTRLTNPIEEKLKEEFGNITFEFAENITDASVHLPKANIILTYGNDITPEHIEVASELKWIMVLSAGVEQMPLKEIKERNILMANVRGIHKTQMAEYALAMLLNHYQNLAKFYESQKRKEWNKEVNRREITGRTLTVVGAGSIGEEIARLGKAFQMKTIAVTQSGGERPYFDQVHKQDTVKEALQDADFVISILPSTKETKGYYSAEHFEWMKTSAVFMNIGRGDVVEEKTLLDALDNNQIEHAILDVTPIEPLPKESRIWSHEKITLTPHISGGSEQYIPRAINIFKENLIQFLKDGTLVKNEMNLDRGY